jgi:hypothetical protein
MSSRCRTPCWNWDTRSTSWAAATASMRTALPRSASKAAPAWLRFFAARLERIATRFLQPGQAALVRAHHRACAAARSRPLRCRALPRPPADDGALCAAPGELRPDPPRPGQRMHDPPALQAGPCMQTRRRARLRRLHPPGPEQLAALGVRDGGAPLPLGNRGRLRAPQDHLRLRLPAPRLPAQRARCRPVARARDPQLHRLPLPARARRSGFRRAGQGRSCWSGASTPARASANSWPRSRAGCRSMRASTSSAMVRCARSWKSAMPARRSISSAGSPTTK